MPWNKANVPPSPEARPFVSIGSKRAIKYSNQPSFVPKRRQIKTYITKS